MKRLRIDLRDPMMALRWIAVVGQAATILVTWRLWAGRTYPPLLAVGGLSLPKVSVGLPLLALLGLSLFRARLGVVLFTGLLGFALVADQTRLQPEVISLALLLVASVLPRAGLLVARAHLVTMWCWAGVHKLLSLDFSRGAADWMFDGLPFQPAFLRSHFGWWVAGMEITVGVLTSIRRTRRLGVVLAVVLHGMILYVLSPFGHDWNESVWAWNLAIPLAAVAVFWPWPTAFRASGDRPRRSRVRTAILVGPLALFPAGFYAGLVDAYPAHNLYSANTANASCETSCRDWSFGETWTAFRVPLPPEPRLYRAYFDAACAPGDRLVIAPRRVRLLFGRHTETERHDCPSGR